MGLQEVPDLWKTALCKQWKQGLCPFSSETCRFAHGKHERRMSSAFTKQLTAKQLPRSMPRSESTWSSASGGSSQSLPSIDSSPQWDEPQNLEGDVMPSLQFGMPPFIANALNSDTFVGDASIVGPPEIQSVPPQCSVQRAKAANAVNKLEAPTHSSGAIDADHGQHET